MHSTTMNRTVLLIDDNELDNYISRMVMEQEGFGEHIVDLQSALKALDFLKKISHDPEQIPDIIFLDIKMPIMDGFGFLEEFNSLPASVREKTRIVMLSSSLNAKDMERAHKNPYVIKFLSKPLTREQILEL
jgi:CheY-like chemotaxis protein